MPTLVLNQNTWATRRQATTYLDGSARASDWPFRAGADQDRALISAFRILEKLLYSGQRTGAQYATAAAIQAAGTGMAVGTLLTAVGGVGTPLVLEVLTLSGGGVATVEIVTAGGYTTSPSGVVTFTGGNDDFTANLTLVDQSGAFPRTGIVDRDGQPLSATAIPADYVSAQIELANELSLNPGLETAPSQGSNRKRVKAGSAEVEFFRPTIGTRDDKPIPRVAFDLISYLIGGNRVDTSPSGSKAFGTDKKSSFDESDRFNRCEGFA